MSPDSDGAAAAVAPAPASYIETLMPVLLNLTMSHFALLNLIGSILRRPSVLEGPSLCTPNRSHQSQKVTISIFDALVMIGTPARLGASVCLDPSTTDVFDEAFPPIATSAPAPPSCTPLSMDASRSAARDNYVMHKTANIKHDTIFKKDDDRFNANNVEVFGCEVPVPAPSVVPVAGPVCTPPSVSPSCTLSALVASRAAARGLVDKINKNGKHNTANSMHKSLFKKDDDKFDDDNVAFFDCEVPVPAPTVVPVSGPVCSRPSMAPSCTPSALVASRAAARDLDDLDTKHNTANCKLKTFFKKDVDKFDADCASALDCEFPVSPPSVVHASGPLCTPSAASPSCTPCARVASGAVARVKREKREKRDHLGYFNYTFLNGNYNYFDELLATLEGESFLAELHHFVASCDTPPSFSELLP